jgi:hypothetical protein
MHTFDSEGSCSRRNVIELVHAFQGYFRVNGMVKK